MEGPEIKLLSVCLESCPRLEGYYSKLSQRKALLRVFRLANHTTVHTQLGSSVTRKPSMFDKRVNPEVAHQLLKLSVSQVFKLQGSAKRRSPGLVNFVAAVAYHFCLALPAAFTQSGGHLLADPCILSYLCCLCHIGNWKWGDESLYLVSGCHL